MDLKGNGRISKHKARDYGQLLLSHREGVISRIFRFEPLETLW
jgi:hypothetical protein